MLHFWKADEPTRPHLTAFPSLPTGRALRVSLLLVYLQEARLLALELAAHDAGVVVERARNALYAERRMEHWRPQVVVCAEHLEDASGAHLRNKLRAQKEFDGVTFVLLAQGGKAPFPTTPRDVVLDAGMTTPELWRRLAPLVGATPTSAHAEGVKRAARMRGALAAFPLFELLGSFQHTRKTGQLTLHLDELDADLFWLDGEIKHAEFLGLYGEDALRRAVIVSDELPGAEFTFEALAPEMLRDLPHTVERSVERLLLELAVRLDHERARRGE